MDEIHLEVFPELMDVGGNPKNNKEDVGGRVEDNSNVMSSSLQVLSIKEVSWYVLPFCIIGLLLRRHP